MSQTAQERKSALRLWHEGLETLLVATPAFRERTESPSMHTARAHVFWDEAEADGYDAADEQHRMRPLAVIKEAEFRYSQYGVSDSNNLAAAGALILMLVDNARFREDHKASKADFLDFAGSVIDQMAERSGQGDFVPVIEIDVTGPPLRSPWDKRTGDDWWSLAAIFRFDAVGGG